MTAIQTVVVAHHRTSTTSRFREVEKAVENLYYVLLLERPAYAQRSGRWRRWAAVGFDITVREPPRDVDRDDRLHIDIDPCDAPRIPMRLRDGDADTKQQLARVLDALDQVRAQGNGASDDERAAAILATDPVQELLVGPLLAALADDGVDADDTERYLQMVAAAVSVLTEPNVASVQVS